VDSALAPQARHRHPVLGQGAGLVDAQHRGGTEDLDGGEAARQDLAARQAPGADGGEHSEDDGEFLWQHRHRQGNAGEQRLQRIAAAHQQQAHQQGTDRAAQQCKAARQARGLTLQSSGRRRDRAQRRPEAADFAPGAGGADLRQPMALHHQGSGIDPGQSGATRGRGRCAIRRGQLADRDRLSREQGFVDHQGGRCQQQRVGRHAVALAQFDKIAGDQLARGNPAQRAAAPDERGRRTQVAQGLQRAFGAPFLDQGHAEHQHHHAEQEGALARLTQQQVEHGSSCQQQVHRLARGIGGDPAPAPGPGVGQAVGPVPCEAPRGFFAVQASQGGLQDIRRHASPAAR